MKSLQTIEEVLEQLEPMITVNDLARNMCDPFWQATQFQLRNEMVDKISEMREVSARALSEIQHKLIDEFVDPTESLDEETLSQVMEWMVEFIPTETRRDIVGAFLQEAKYY